MVDFDETTDGDTRKRLPSEYEIPQKKANNQTQIQTSSSRNKKDSTPNDSSIDVLEGSDSPLQPDQGANQSHTPAGVIDDDNDTDSGYFMLDESGTGSLVKRPVFNEYSPSPPPPACSSQLEATGKAKTPATAAAPDYELPIDAQRDLKSSTVNEDYETPLDAASS